MIDLANYTGPVVNVEAPPMDFRQWKFRCPVCERQFGIGGAIWRIPTYDGNYLEETLAFPPTVTLQRIATYSNGVDKAEIFMTRCHVCATVYQSWRVFMNVGVMKVMEYIIREQIYPTDSERKIGFHEWVQVE
jgi:hypothetical protein